MNSRIKTQTVISELSAIIVSTVVSFVFVFHQQNFYENPKMDTSMKHNRDLHQISPLSDTSSGMTTCKRQQMVCPGGGLPPRAVSSCSLKVVPRASVLGLQYSNTGMMCLCVHWHASLAVPFVDGCLGRGHSSELSAVSQRGWVRKNSRP